MRNLLLAAVATALATPAAAQPAKAPKLVVAISVDQLSSDLWEAYRPHFTGGFARLAREGVTFTNGYQAHAATETCPGHSTLLTGRWPAATGIVANQWIDQKTPRADKTIYCAEDESVAGSTHESYTVSDRDSNTQNNCQTCRHKRCHLLFYLSLNLLSPRSSL